MQEITTYASARGYELSKYPEHIQQKFQDVYLTKNKSNTLKLKTLFECDWPGDIIELALNDILAETKLIAKTTASAIYTKSFIANIPYLVEVNNPHYKSKTMFLYYPSILAHMWRQIDNAAEIAKVNKKKVKSYADEIAVNSIPICIEQLSYTELATDACEQYYLKEIAEAERDPYWSSSTMVKSLSSICADYILKNLITIEGKKTKSFPDIRVLSRVYTMVAETYPEIMAECRDRIAYAKKSMNHATKYQKYNF